MGVRVTDPQDDHYKRVFRVTVGVQREKTLNAYWALVPNIGQNLQSFSGMVTSPYE